DGTRGRVDDRHRDELAVLGEDLGHSHLLTDESLHVLHPRLSSPGARGENPPGGSAGSGAICQGTPINQGPGPRGALRPVWMRRLDDMPGTPPRAETTPGPAEQPSYGTLLL